MSKKRNALQTFNYETDIVAVNELNDDEVESLKQIVKDMPINSSVNDSPTTHKNSLINQTTNCPIKRLEKGIKIMKKTNKATIT